VINSVPVPTGPLFPAEKHIKRLSVPLQRINDTHVGKITIELIGLYVCSGTRDKVAFFYKV